MKINFSIAVSSRGSGKYSQSIFCLLLMQDFKWKIYELFVMLPMHIKEIAIRPFKDVLYNEAFQAV